MIPCKLLVFALAGFAAASPHAKRWEEMKTKHEWAEIPAGWSDDGPAPANAVLDLRVALKQDRFEELLEHLNAVSDPFHERYGAHLSKEEVDTLLAPHPDSVALIEDWLLYHEIDMPSVSRSGSGDTLSFKVTVTQAERMLGTSYRLYRNPSTDTTVIRTLQYQIPSILHEHVQLVSPTTYFNGLRAMKSTIFKTSSAPTVPQAPSSQADYYPSSCDYYVDPQCLIDVYNITLPEVADSKSVLGINGYLEEYASYSDLISFEQNFAPWDNKSFMVVEINGGLNNQSEPGTEANLDVQYAGSLSGPIPNTLYSTGGSPPFKPDDNTPTDTNEPYLEFLTYMLEQSKVPSVISSSYGDDEQTVPYEYAITVCNAFAALGARGVSLIVSSGDTGVGGADCKTNDGRNITRFQPIFPAACPYVTSVGATASIAPETAAGFSSGGFSNYFVRQAYQELAVESYLARLGKTYFGLFNEYGYGFPVVAALGVDFIISVDYDWYTVDGTSCSAPVWGAVIALLNDLRFKKGEPALGFLNPWLYSEGYRALNDITEGSNPGCGTEGFNATSGWDPVTGLGTPNFFELKKLLGLV